MEVTTYKQFGNLIYSLLLRICMHIMIMQCCAIEHLNDKIITKNTIVEWRYLASNGTRICWQELSAQLEDLMIIQIRFARDINAVWYVLQFTHA